MQKFSSLFLIVLFSLTSCQENDNFNNKIDKEVTFTSTINQNEIGVQELATRWQQGDQIGIFVNGVPKYDNTLYTTNGSGFFASNTPVPFPKGTVSYNFTAYYPYNQSTRNNTINIDLAKNHQNVRYSNNLKNVGRDNIVNLNNLEFKSLLPKIYMLINTSGISASPVEAQATVTAPAKASLSLSDGKLTIDEHSTTTYSLEVIAPGAREVIKGILKISFKIPNSS